MLHTFFRVWGGDPFVVKVKGDKRWNNVVRFY